MHSVIEGTIPSTFNPKKHFFGCEQSMTDLDIDINYQPGSFALSGHQRYYLKYDKIHEDSTYRATKIERDITDSFNQLPVRWQALFDDLWLFTNSSNIDFEKQRVWDDLTDVEARFESDQKYTGINTHQFSKNDNKKFGYEIGRSIGWLCPSSEEKGLEDVLSGILFGAIDNPVSEQQKEADTFRYIIEYLLREYRLRYHSTGKVYDQIDFLLKQQENERVITQAFAQTEYEPLSPIVGEVLEILDRDGQQVTKANIIIACCSLQN